MLYKRKLAGLAEGLECVAGKAIFIVPVCFFNFFAMFRLKSIVSEKTCKNILVRGVNWIGDAVMTMPALRGIKLSHPDSKITLLVKPWVSSLFEKDPNVDEIILYLDEYKGILGKFRLANKIRKNNFCMALLFQNAIDAAFITFLSGIPERIGYSRDGRRILLTKPVPFNNNAKRLHHVKYYLNLIDRAGFTTKESLPWIYMTLDERLNARDKLKALKRPVIAVNPGAAFGSSKRWHPDRFAEVARRIIHEINGSVVILGGPSEIGIAEEIFNAFRIQKSTVSPPTQPSPSRGEGKGGGETSQLLNFAGKTSLRELAALISECDALVTNDSGPMHIGYAVGTPVVAIFGSTSPELTGPVGKGNIVIRKELDCSPCFERECRKRDLKCMDLITYEEVFESVKKIISSKRAVFLDRDGTLCRDMNYLNKMEDLEIFPEVAYLARIKEKGFKLIGISNQSGIARGLVDENIVKQVNNIFIDKYGFDGFYFCPHHPDEHCFCRKPEPGLLLKARIDHNIDLKGSFFIGDKESDMILAKAVGAKGILVKTGHEISSSYADFTVNDLKEAVDAILRLK